MNTLHRVLRVTAVTVALGLSTAMLPCAYANLGGDTQESADENFLAGKQAVKEQDWKRAVDQLEKAISAEPQNADARNFLGYAYRKLGFMPQSLLHYKEALKLNPGHRNAHEYIGEAYLMMDQVKEAEQHLAALDKLCSPIPCEEQKMLKRAIDEYKKGVRSN